MIILVENTNFEVLNEVEMGNVLGGGPKGSTREQDVFDPDEE